MIDQMSLLTLAVWYMDDGSWNPNLRARQATICTDDFPHKDVEYASQVLKKRYGLNAPVYYQSFTARWGKNVNRKIPRPRLIFLRSTVEKFFNIIRPHIHPTMTYKLDHP